MPIEDFLDWVIGKFDQLPWYGQLIVLLFAIYLIIRGFQDRIVHPALDAIGQIGISLQRILGWLADKLTGGKKALEEEPVAPTRVIPEERTIWERQAPASPVVPKSGSIPIITVANMKGGVAKTTVVANLAPYFRDVTGKPTLVIDFDYQGSLSQCVRGEAGYTDPDLTADVLLGTSPDDPFLFAREMRRGVENVFIYPANYPFATIENNLLADWLNGRQENLMYRLCEQLRRPEFQNKYGAVLIDSPPRLTPGSINALCASTHLLVPTTLDDMSAQAAIYFLTQLNRMRETVFPSLRILGVVPTITSREREEDLQLQEVRSLARLRKFGSEEWKRDDFVLAEAVVRRRAEIARAAGVGVAYTRSHAAKEVFEKLGKAVQSRL